MKPTHFLNLVTGEGRSAVFTRVAALWPTQSGGFSGEIPAGLTVSGRLVITEAKAQQPGENGGQQ